MWLSIVNNKTGKKEVVESKLSEVLIGSGPECDIKLAGDGIFRQHARVIHVSHHHFLIVKREENGDIEPVIREELTEYGTNYHWNGRGRRIDTHPFEIGEFTVCVSGPLASLVDRRPISLSISYENGEPFKTIDFPNPEVLIGSGPECDLVLEAEGVFRQHARVVRSINAFLLVEERDTNGEIEPVLRDTMDEYGSYYHAQGRNIVIDNDAFPVGPFFVRVTSEYGPEGRGGLC